MSNSDHQPQRRLDRQTGLDGMKVIALVERVSNQRWPRACGGISFPLHIIVILPVIHICPQHFLTISSVGSHMVNQSLTLMSESFFME
ncbi:hypothetical protein D3C80_326670 [compost metagenome]